MSTCCPGTIYSVPGPPGADGSDGAAGANGSNAFTLLDGGFLMPNELASIVTVVEDNTWMALGQPVFVQGAGFMQVSAINANGTGVTLTNLADTANDLYPDNASPGASIPDQAKVSPAGFQGSAGTDGAAGGVGPAGPDGPPGSNGFSVTTADYIQPAVGTNVTISVEDSQGFGIGQILFVEGGGFYEVISIPSALQVELENLGYTGSVVPTTNVPDPAKVVPAGVQGATGPAGAAGTTLANAFRADKNGSNQIQTVGGLGMQVTFGTEQFDSSGVWNNATSIFAAPATGIYEFTVQLLTVPNATPTADYFALSLYKNGVTLVAQAVHSADSAVPVSRLLCSGPIALNATDTIQVFSYQNSGNADNINGAATGTWISGVRLA